MDTPFLGADAALAVAIFTIVLGLLVLATRPRALNLACAGFLVSRGVADFAYQMMRQAASSGEAVGWLRFANACEVPALACGVLFLHLAFPARGPLRRGALVLVGAFTVVAVATIAMGSPLFSQDVKAGPSPGGAVLYGVLPAPFGRVYQAATWLFEAAGVMLATSALGEPGRTPTEKRRRALLGVAFAVPLANVVLLWAFFRVQHLLMGSTPANLVFGVDGGGLVEFALTAAAAILGALAVARGARPLVGAFAGLQRLAVVSLFVAAAAAAAFDAALPSLATAGLSLPAGYVNSRFVWVGVSFSCLAAALVRHDLAGLGDRAYRRVSAGARVALLAALVGLPAAAVLALLGLSSWTFILFLVLAMGALTLASAPLRALSDAIARLLVGSRGGQLDRYVVERELGRGGFGTALLAQDSTTGERVVLKRLHAASGDRRGLDEARAMRALRHPRVVPLVDVIETGGERVLVLGYVPGGDAAGLLAREGPLSAPRAARLAADALEGLEALHAAGVAHGDVKPANLLLDAQGRGVLADLGAARSLVATDATITVGLGAGSYAALPPERLRGARPDARGDVYAAGALLYRLLTGEDYVAIEGRTTLEATEAILHDAPRLPHPRVPRPLVDIVGKALRKRPEERYPSAGQMRAALVRALAEMEDGPAMARPGGA